VRAGSPAEKAGLRKGDIIKAVNGRSLYSLSFWSMYMSLFSAAPGQELELIVLKKNENKPMRLNLATEAPAAAQAVEPIWEAGAAGAAGIPVLHIGRIDAQTVSQLQPILSRPYPQGLIVDLRRYSGGDFNSLKSLCRYFFNEQTLQIKTRRGMEDHLLGSAKRTPLPVAVLVDESTILYAELLAALFKKNNQPLLGSRTPGCATFMQSFNLADGSSLVLTTGYFRHGSKELGRTGTEPTIRVKAEDAGRIFAIAASTLHKMNEKKEKS